MVHLQWLVAFIASYWPLVEQFQLRDEEHGHTIGHSAASCNECKPKEHHQNQWSKCNAKYYDEVSQLQCAVVQVAKFRNFLLGVCPYPPRSEIKTMQL